MDEKKVRAKFRCISFTKLVDGNKVSLCAITRGDPEDEAFWKATPWGNLEMGVLNDQAAKYFEPGAEYLVTFERAPTPSE